MQTKEHKERVGRRPKVHQSEFRVRVRVRVKGKK
jgi:hypothetical protein